MNGLWHADTILKKYSSTVATIFTGFASAALFGHTLTINFMLGISIVFISMHQVWQTEFVYLYESNWYAINPLPDSFSSSFRPLRKWKKKKMGFWSWNQFRVIIGTQLLAVVIYCKWGGHLNSFTKWVVWCYVLSI